jgi:hypothetical protein
VVVGDVLQRVGDAADQIVLGNRHHVAHRNPIPPGRNAHRRRPSVSSKQYTSPGDELRQRRALPPAPPSPKASGA